jgi:lysophospholipase L1-like esterase
MGSACGSTPTQPPPPPQLSLQCPVALDVTARDGTAAEVAYGLQLTGGAAGASVACTPPSGSLLPLGASSVSCTASDSIGQSAGCVFVVRVHAPPRLRYTRFLAFGDSITEGVVSPAPTLLLQLGTPQAYPGLLQTSLAERYTAQAIEVLNRGVAGERLITGRDRLPDVLDEDRPEVLLLQEGINNLRNVPTAELASDFRSMVRTAQRRGVTVLPALLLPVSEAREAGRPGTQAGIRAFNEEIRRISLDLGCGEPVDLYSLFQQDLSLLGVDGLHPTEAGYIRMAEAFFEAIKARWEEAPAPSPAPAVSVR